MTQRVVGAGAVRGSAAGAVRGTGAPKPAPAPEPPPRRPRRKRAMILAIVAVIALGTAGAAWAGWIPGIDGAASPSPAAEPTAEPGETVDIEPVSLNLADGHYLRIGFTLQLTADAAEVSDAAVKDIVIDLFSGRSVADINDETTRAELKETLLALLNDAFEGTVMNLYYTDYVTQ